MCERVLGCVGVQCAMCVRECEGVYIRVCFNSRKYACLLT